MTVFKPGVLTTYIVVAVAIVAAFVNVAFGQNETARNNPYSPSPSGRAETRQTIAASRVEPAQVAYKLRPAARTDEYTDDKMAGFGPAPTMIYRVGVGDVLYVHIRNTTAAGIYPVRPDWTIDFPLITQDPVVAGQTIDAIETMLRSRITLYPDPDVEVRVRKYASHKVTVSGSVHNAGDLSLQREAVPLYVIKAMTFVHPDATRVMITRAPRFEAESYDLGDPFTDNVTIVPGDHVEFVSDAGSISRVVRRL